MLLKITPVEQFLNELKQIEWFSIRTHTHTHTNINSCRTDYYYYYGCDDDDDDDDSFSKTLSDNNSVVYE